MFSKMPGIFVSQYAKYICKLLFCVEYYDQCNEWDVIMGKLLLWICTI